jgi:hypothetical protein
MEALKIRRKAEDSIYVRTKKTMVWALSQDDYNLSLAMALGTENNLKTF